MNVPSHHILTGIIFISYYQYLIVYRWGFRQLNRGIGPDEPIVFGNEFFQQNRPELMVNMRSITAATTRKHKKVLVQKMLASKDHRHQQQVQQLQAVEMATLPSALSSLYGCNFNGMGPGYGVGATAGAIASDTNFLLGRTNHVGARANAGLHSSMIKQEPSVPKTAASVATMNRMTVPPSLFSGAVPTSLKNININTKQKQDQYTTPGFEISGVSADGVDSNPFFGLGLGDTTGRNTNAKQARLSRMTNNELQDL